MLYFFYVGPETPLLLLRPATETEVEWYNGLADTLKEYRQNVNRFERVDKNYRELLATIKCKGKNVAQIERDAKCATANFLYAFNECIDHWKTYIHRTYGKDSDYFKRYVQLTSDAYDTFDEYRITYGLRNYQHVDWVVHRVSTTSDYTAQLYTNRDIVLRDGGLNKTQKEALQKQPDWIELLPIFATAKKQLEQINVKLVFYTVTPEIEARVLEALRFKESFGVSGGSIMLGVLLDERGNELVPNHKTFNALAQNNQVFSFSYDKEIPWGICDLIKRFQGTDYKNC